MKFLALRPAILTTGFNLCKDCLKGRKRSGTSPVASFPAWFLKKNIHLVLITNQSLLPDFEKLYKIHRKIHA